MQWMVGDNKSGGELRSIIRFVSQGPVYVYNFFWFTAKLRNTNMIAAF